MHTARVPRQVGAGGINCSDLGAMSLSGSRGSAAAHALLPQAGEEFSVNCLVKLGKSDDRDPQSCLEQKVNAEN